MAKIGSTRVAMPSLNFGDSNNLMKSGLEALTEALDPIKTAMDANFAEREANAKGQVLEQISQGMPRDYATNPAEFDAFAKQFFDNNNLAREGVTQEDLFAMLNNAGDVREKQRGAYITNQAKQHTNLVDQDKYTANLILNAVESKEMSPEEGKDLFRQFNLGGVNTNEEYNASSQRTLKTQGTALKNHLIALSPMHSDAIARESNKISSKLGKMNNTHGGGSSMGKSQAPSLNSSNPQNGSKSIGITSGDGASFYRKLVGSESSGDSKGEYNDSKGRKYAGLIQMGKDRLIDYANATKTKPMTPAQFKQLSAAEQEVVNSWHLNDLANFAKNSGGLGRVINGTYMDLDALMSVAHLGGKVGLAEYLKGNYNPSDELGTSLSDYAAKFSNGDPSNAGLQQAIREDEILANGTSVASGNGISAGANNSAINQLIQSISTPALSSDDFNNLIDIEDQYNSTGAGLRDKLYESMIQNASDPTDMYPKSTYVTTQDAANTNALLSNLIGQSYKNESNAMTSLVNELSGAEEKIKKTSKNREAAMAELNNLKESNIPSNGIGISQFIDKEDSEKFVGFLNDGGLPLEQFVNLPFEAQKEVIKLFMERDRKDNSTARKQAKYVDTFDKARLRVDDVSELKNYTGLMDNFKKGIELNHKERNKNPDVAKEKAKGDKWYSSALWSVPKNVLGWGKNDALKKLEGQQALELALAREMDRHFKDNFGNFRYSGEGDSGNMSILPNNSPQTYANILKNAVKYYDESIRAMDKPEEDYYSYNLTGDDLEIQQAKINEAAVSALEKASAHIQQTHDKKVTPPDHTGRITIPEHLAKKALTNEK